MGIKSILKGHPMASNETKLNAKRRAARSAAERQAAKVLAEINRARMEKDQRQQAALADVLAVHANIRDCQEALREAEKIFGLALNAAHAEGVSDSDIETYTGIARREMTAARKTAAASADE